MRKLVVLVALLFVFGGGILAQSPPGNASADTINGMATDLSNISRSVQILNSNLKAIVDQLGKLGANPTTEKAQKMLTGLDILVRAEQRLAAQQTFQIDLTERQGTNRTRLAQVERDLMPQQIDRSVQFEGSTRTDELRDNRRGALQAERTSLLTLLAQITNTLSETNDAVKESLGQVQRLRRLYLPQIEREMQDAVQQ
ncbi:hypothetical protein BH10ACI2_BH10ACI2_05410 [soil metagenome]